MDADEADRAGKPRIDDDFGVLARVIAADDQCAGA
jgi:hypothetical protein